MKENNSVNQGSILIKNELNSNEELGKVSSYIRYFHTSDGARNRNTNYYNSSSLDPYHDCPPYIQHSGSSDFLGTWKPFKTKDDRSTINSESGARLHEEDSPFFIKRRIRSSNPHTRIKRKPHPMICKQFFKKQMSRRGARKDISKCSLAVYRIFHQLCKIYCLINIDNNLDSNFYSESKSNSRSCNKDYVSITNQKVAENNSFSSSNYYIEENLDWFK